MSSKRPKKAAENVLNEIDRWPSNAAGRSYASSNILVSDGRLLVLSEAQTSKMGQNVCGYVDLCFTSRYRNSKPCSQAKVFVIHGGTNLEEFADSEKE